MSRTGAELDARRRDLETLLRHIVFGNREGKDRMKHSWKNILLSSIDRVRRDMAALPKR